MKILSERNLTRLSDWILFKKKSNNIVYVRAGARGGADQERFKLIFKIPNSKALIVITDQGNFT